MRRADAIAAHLSSEMFDPDSLLRLFDLWLDPSFSLRNYLWAEKDEDVRVARQLVETLPPATIVEILKYLAESYWARYLGWPDLLLWKPGAFFLAEVKSSGDKLSEDQKGWIRDNAERLPAKLTVSVVETARQNLEAIPPAPKESKQVPVSEVIRSLSPTIRKLLARGYSRDQVIELLREQGIPATRWSLRDNFRHKAAVGGKVGLTPANGSRSTARPWQTPSGI